MDFGGLEPNSYGVVLADPPWHWKAWSKYKELKDGSKTRATEKHYRVMSTADLMKLPVAEVCKEDAALFMWFIWPMLEDAMATIDAWGFKYKSCAFCWIKGDVRQFEMFQDDLDDPFVGMGYWTRANSEACLLATRGSPKRLNADVRQAIVEPRRQHSRKPDCVYERVERLVEGPYLELFARNKRPGWTSLGDQAEKFPEVKAQQVEMFTSDA